MFSIQGIRILREVIKLFLTSTDFMLYKHSELSFDDHI